MLFAGLNGIIINTWINIKTNQGTVMKITKETVGELSRRRPFDRMLAAHVQWLVTHLEQIEFKQDTEILLPGMPCVELFFIHKGTVQLEAIGNAADEKKVLAELVEGECFPLEAMEERRPVFSTFRANSEVICYRLTIEDFDELKKMSSVFADFCRYRSQSFLEQSRRIFQLHFSHKSDEQQRLNTPLSILMSPNPLTAKPEDHVRDVVSKMFDNDVDAATIINDNNVPIGIFTMRDLLRKIIVPKGDLDIPIVKVMTESPQTLSVSALGYEAALLLTEAGFHHVILVDKGKLAGIVTERDLFNLQRVSLSQLNAEIQAANNLDKLKRCSSDIHLLSESMLIQGVTADHITQIISTLNDQIITRTLDLELAKEELKGLKVAWIALGSQGRYEQTFFTDQDNGIIFDVPEGEDAESVRARLLPIAQRVNQALDFVGFSLCKGNIMAGNPECCLSYREWQVKFNKWIQEPTPDSLLKATIFFDFRHLYGETSLSDRLRTWLAEAAIGQKRFFHLLAENAKERTPPLGFFRDFIVEDSNKEHPGTIDIKQNGVTLFVDAARAFALASGVTRGNTRERLIAAGDLRKWPQSEVNAWADAFSFLQSLRIRHQFELMQNGRKSNNQINPYDLNQLDRKFFLESLRQAGKLQKQLSMDFGMGM
jgi:CBS domain-containing protein